MMQKFILKKQLPPNVDGRDFIIGDLHGCYDELKNLLAHVDFNPNIDRIISTGDLIDRGPRQEECLSLLGKKWFYPILGNHEDMLINKMIDYQNNDLEDLDSKEIDFIKNNILYLPKLLNLPLIYEIEHLLYDNFIVVHAEILPEHIYDFNESNLQDPKYESFISLMKRKDFSNEILNFINNRNNKNITPKLKQKLLWSRKIITTFYKEIKEKIITEEVLQQPFKQKNKIFCGHNVVPFPLKIGQQFYIDTGAALGYQVNDLNAYIFSQFKNDFFVLTMVDITTGICYGCITSEPRRGEIIKTEKSLYTED